MTSANQTPGGYKFAPLVASQQGRANQHEPACFGLSSPWSFTFGHTTACRSPALALSASIYFAMTCSAPCSAVLHHSPSSWAAVVHWSALMPKAQRSSRKHSIHSFPDPPHSPRPHHFSKQLFSSKCPPPFAQFHVQVFSTQVVAFVLPRCWVRHSHHASTSPASTLLLTRVFPPSIPPLLASGPTFSAASVSQLCYRRHGCRGKRLRFVGGHHHQSMLLAGMLLAGLHCQHRQVLASIDVMKEH